MRALVDALYELALKLNVRFNFNQEVLKLNIEDNTVKSMEVNGDHLKG